VAIFLITQNLRSKAALEKVYTLKNLPIASTERTGQILRELHIKPSKSLGQNFLICGQTADKIGQAALLTEGANVLEIGPGLGALSEMLAQKAAGLTLLEVDERLCLHLQRLFAGAPHVRVENADALDFDYVAHAAQRGWPEYHIVGNLPYYITSSILRCLLLRGGSWQSMTLMMQKEVAEKLKMDSAGGGPLALLLQYFGSARLVLTAPPDIFFPAPQVQSAVLHVQRRAEPPFALDDTAAFERFLHAAFNQRRKTLVNSLSSMLGGGKELWLAAFKACAIAENQRAEQLTLNEFGALYNLPSMRMFTGRAEPYAY